MNADGHERRTDTSVPPQVFELHLDRPLGRGPQRRIDVGIDVFHHLAYLGLRTQCRQGGAYLVEPILAVREVLAAHRLEIRQFRAVTGQHRPSRAEADEIPQGGEVVAEVPVGVVEHGGAPAQNRVGGEHRALALDLERHRVRGVSRGRKHPQPQSRGLDHLPGFEAPATTVPVCRIDTPDRAAGEFSEPRDAPGVVFVTVADQRERDGDGRNTVQVRLILRPRVHDDALVAARCPQDPGVGAIQRHHSRVLGQHHGSAWRDLPESGVGGMYQCHSAYFRHQRTSAISSTSTGAPRGSSATPTADRAWTPASPNTSPRNSDAPLITPGCPVKLGAEATKPTTFTIRTTESIPTSASSAANAFRAQIRAAVLASASPTAPPTLPVTSS